jgi:hypothetical protein
VSHFPLNFSPVGLCDKCGISDQQLIDYLEIDTDDPQLFCLHMELNMTEEMLDKILYVVEDRDIPHFFATVNCNIF